MQFKRLYTEKRESGGRGETKVFSSNSGFVSGVVVILAIVVALVMVIVLPVKDKC